MNEIVQDLSAPALIDAIEADLYEPWLLFQYWPQAEVHDDPDMLWMITNVPFSTFNCVLRAQVARGQVDAAIETAMARVRARNLPMAWFVGPASRPAGLGVALEAHGFVHLADLPGMAADLYALPTAPPIVPGLVIEQVGDLPAQATWCRTFVTGHDLPAAFGDAKFDSHSNLGFGAHIPLRTYLGRLDGEPVATSKLTWGAGVAGISEVATVAEVRRKGIGAAMTWHAMHEGRKMGSRLSTLWASELGVGIYRRLGFQEYCKGSVYEWDPGSH